jgi:hypothetical protein
MPTRMAEGAEIYRLASPHQLRTVTVADIREYAEPSSRGWVAPTVA